MEITILNLLYAGIAISAFVLIIVGIISYLDLQLYDKGYKEGKELVKEMPLLKQSYYNQVSKLKESCYKQGLLDSLIEQGAKANLN